jgi:Tol biopolymer transport system component
VTALDPLLRALDVLIVPTDGAGDAERLTLALAADSDPVWSPDGTRVLFRSMQSGTPGLFVRRVQQADAAAEPMLQSELDETPTDWAGADVLVHARGSTSVDVLRLRTGTGAYEAVADTPFNEREARWAPDRRWMTYVSDESGLPDVYARRPDGTRVRVSFAGGTRPRWTRDGAGIVFVRGSQVMRADRAAGDPARFTPPRALFEAAGLRDFDVAHRTDRFIAILPANGGADVTVSAVLNWRSLLGAP